MLLIMVVAFVLVMWDVWVGLGYIIGMTSIVLAGVLISWRSKIFGYVVGIGVILIPIIGYLLSPLFGIGIMIGVVVGVMVGMYYDWQNKQEGKSCIKRL